MRASTRSSGRTLLFLLALAGWVASSPAAPKKTARPTPGAALFNDGRIRTFKFTVVEPGLSTLQKNERSYVKAGLTEGDQVFSEVGLHLKGMGSFQPFNQKPSFVVKFDRYDDRGEYDGLTRFALNNSSQDGTYLAELMATQMFRDAGVPAARVTHAFVELNGRKLGLYVLIEAMNKEFLKRHFTSAKGNLYEAYLADIDSKMDQDGGVDTTQADVKKLAAVCKIPSPTERWSRLQEVFEVDRFLSHQVCEMFTSHSDGYANNRNNYRIYHDPATGRFNMIAHGLDWGFQDTGFSIRPKHQAILTRAVLQTPQGRLAFKERGGQLFTNIFRLEVLTNRVNQVVARLKSVAPTPEQSKDYDRYGVEMCGRLVARAKSIADQLALPDAEVARFDASGTAMLTNWYAGRTNINTGTATNMLVQDGGKLLRHVQAGTNGGMASWRARAELPQGSYRFMAVARCAKLVPTEKGEETGVGAGVRLSGDKRSNNIVGDADWTTLHHDFVVAEGGEEKEFVCELRAKSGEVWFDAASVKIVRR